MSNPVNLLLSPGASRNAAGPISPTLTGAVRDIAGGWLLEEPTTNRNINPSGRSGATTGWSAAASTTISAVGSGASARIRGTRSSETNATFALLPPSGSGNRPNITAGNPVTVSGTVQSVYPCRLSILWRDATGGFGLTIQTDNGAYEDVTGGQFIEATFTAPLGTLSYITQITCNDGGGAGSIGRTFEFHEMQFENLDHATTAVPQFDGSNVLLDGYAYTGAAHITTSTRAAASVVADLTDAPAAVAYRISEDGGDIWTTGYSESLGQIAGDDGSITHDAGEIILASNRATIFDTVLAFDRTLTASEQSRLTSSSALTWDVLTRLPIPILRIGSSHIGPLRVGRK